MRITERIHPEKNRESTMSNDIAYLKEWISKQPHLPQDLDEPFLNGFLIGCKYSLEKCKRKLDAYFSARVAMPSLFANRDPTSEEMKTSANTINTCLVRGLPGEVFGFAKVMDLDVKNYSFEAFLRRLTIILDYTIRDPQVTSFLLIADVDGLTLEHLTKTSPLLTRDFAVSFQESYPFRLAGLHLINLPTFAEALVKVIIQLAPEKLKKRVHFNTKDFNDIVPRELMPKEFGGNAGTMTHLHRELQDELENFREIFLQDAAKLTSEQYRCGKNIFLENSNGLEGSFRKLDID